MGLRPGGSGPIPEPGVAGACVESAEDHHLIARPIIGHPEVRSRSWVRSQDFLRPACAVPYPGIAVDHESREVCVPAAKHHDLLTVEGHPVIDPADRPRLSDGFLGPVCSVPNPGVGENRTLRCTTEHDHLLTNRVIRQTSRVAGGRHRGGKLLNPVAPSKTQDWLLVCEPLYGPPNKTICCRA